MCGAPDEICWFANEVYTGMGMQRIDVLLILEQERQREFRILELKTNPISMLALERQLRRYILWIGSFVARPDDIIQPVLTMTFVPDEASLNEYQAMSRMLSEELGSAPLQVWNVTLNRVQTSVSRLV